jgi:hypothetical protein
MSKKLALAAAVAAAVLNLPVSPVPVMVPVAALRVHPLLEHAPRLAAKDPRYLAMRASWRESGVRPTIYITPSGEIVDGRHRYWDALDEADDEMAAIVVDPANVASIILGAVTGRNHTTKAVQAYLCQPIIAPALEQARARRAAMLDAGLKKKLPPIETVEDLAERLGISETYLKQADRIHAAFQNETKFDFNNPPAAAASLVFDTPEEIAEFKTSAGGRKKRSLTLRQYFEPRILDDENPMPLAQVLTGIGYFLNGAPEKTAGKPPKRNSHLHVVISGWSLLAKSAPRWKKLTGDDLESATKAIEKTFQKLPGDLLKMLLATAKRELRRRTSSEEPAGTSPEAEPIET